jgi:hypothetical protein
MLGAIVSMNEKHQNHYDAHCPRCRRANSISRQRMELFFPNWQDAAKQLAANPPKEEVSATAFLKTEPVSKATKAAVEKKAVAKKPAEKAVKKPAAEKASAAKKPAAKTTKAAEPKPKKK